MTLGQSQDQAIHCLISNERSLRCKRKLEEFQAGEAEYFSMGHANQQLSGIEKSSSSTMKLRIVFDVSARMSNSNSLIDTLLPGPCVYPAISDLLFCFRSHLVAVSAGIVKMFREINLGHFERDYHSFLF